MENGARQLMAFFHEVARIDFPGGLSMIKEQAIIDYLLSTNTNLSNVLSNEALDGFLHYLKEKKEANGGENPITKSTGLFVSR